MNERRFSQFTIPLESYDSLAEGLWIKEVIEQQKNIHITKSWSIEENKYTTDLPENTKIVFESIEEKRRELIAEMENCLIYLRFRLNTIVLSLAGEERNEINQMITTIEKLFPKMKANEEGIPVSFWYSNGNRGQNFDRKLETPQWDTIKSNYPRPTAQELEKIMNWSKLPAVGKLVLMQGPPGTGKSHAIRAIGTSWKKWCKIDYITDPESFLNDPGYMLKILLNEDDADDYFDNSSQEENKKSKLIVLEDAGELIKIDAKEGNGQALSRLLNITDGIIGQGLRFIVLISTNEEIKALNEAVMRPGRCIANIKFELFDQTSAQKWAERENFILQPGKSTFSLAELYTIKSGNTLPSTVTRKWPI